MAPFVEFLVNLTRVPPLRTLRDAYRDAPLIHLLDYPVAVKGFICQQRAKLHVLHQGWNTDRIMAIAR